MNIYERKSENKSIKLNQSIKYYKDNDDSVYKNDSIINMNVHKPNSRGNRSSYNIRSSIQVSRQNT
jgi:hypothetical protein